MKKLILVVLISSACYYKPNFSPKCRLTRTKYIESATECWYACPSGEARKNYVERGHSCPILINY